MPQPYHCTIRVRRPVSGPVDRPHAIHAAPKKSVRHQPQPNPVLTERPRGRSFVIAFADDTLPTLPPASQAIRIHDPQEAGRYLYLLGESCEVLVSAAWRATHPDLVTGLAALSYAPQTDAAFNDSETAAALLRSLPLDLAGLLASPLAVRDGDPLPPPIDQRYVHKHHVENVLLSQPHACGRLWHFNLLPETQELHFDHGSEHVQGLLILEGMRQASQATCHLAGFPFGAGNTLLGMNTLFLRFVSALQPIQIRTFGELSEPSERGDCRGFMVSQVFQWGALCAMTVTEAYLFPNWARYAAHQTLGARILERGSKAFAKRLTTLPVRGVAQ